MSTNPADKSIEAFVKQGLQYASSLNNDIIISSHVEKLEQFRYPCRINAITVLVVLGGRMEYSINLKHYTIEDTGILINFPENIITINWARDIEAYAVILSTSYMNQLKVELSQRVASYIQFKRAPFCPVPYADLANLEGYYVLIKWQMDHPNPESSHIVAGLVEAFMYQSISLVDRERVVPAAAQPELSRALEISNQFMQLLAQYHTQERGIAFYASKMCVTRNYLSMVIKQCTGKTVRDWIDEYVVLEAKSLLRFSGLNVQTIAYRLNFPTQSSFGKYFKNKTGLSPKDYIKHHAQSQ